MQPVGAERLQVTLTMVCTAAEIVESNLEEEPGAGTGQQNLAARQEHCLGKSLLDTCPLLRPKPPKGQYSSDRDQEGPCHVG